MGFSTGFKNQKNHGGKMCDFLKSGGAIGPILIWCDVPVVIVIGPRPKLN